MAEKRREGLSHLSSQGLWTQVVTIYPLVP